MHRTYRVVVRGRFTGLDRQQRAALLTTLDQHSLSQAQFTPESFLAYEKDLGFFTHRVLVVEDGESAAACDDAALATGLTAAELALDSLGVSGAGMRVSADCVDDVTARARR